MLLDAARTTRQEARVLIAVSLVMLDGLLHRFDLLQARLPATAEAWSRTTAFFRDHTRKV